MLHDKNHPLRLTTTYDGRHQGAIDYMHDVHLSEGVTTIKVTQSTPNLLHYYCHLHAGMGGLITVVDRSSAMHTPSTHDMEHHDDDVEHHDDDREHQR